MNSPTTPSNTPSKANDRWSSAIQQLAESAGVGLNGSHPWDIQVHNPGFYQRVVQDGIVGLGESYMEGWWECERLDQLFTRLVEAHLNEKMPQQLSVLLSLIWARLANLQSRQRAWIVGEEHYDLGNDLFEVMLDSRMQYSCAYWKEANTLEEAQVAKLDLICRKLDLKPGMKLLDIGCGWGGLAEFAASRYGASVVGITISKKQHQLARTRCKGLDVEVRLQDYRDLNDTFDRVVSVGMFEHVGPRNYDTFFQTVRKVLSDSGLFLLHTIGSLQSDLSVNPWIEKYIFPNGCLPSMLQIARSTEGLFVTEDWHNFGADYDLTLVAWEKRFQAGWPELKGN
ncbi:cyclopropane fatty acyl phospholipid synthase [Endozoicomonas sp. SCSIO W0465]|uniref:cyclopropane fatty acyl phospholipid synthase n=1 Tax=Endozoicomonas sp. SCSIO W0465 TaxID=2918516 RepID=UPI0020753625|nr:cyclopropane fatty acyl phospholipid synthase [Endozoicomonas sp. SCSIO W0465]USE37735.1 cyclopropane fatty acyl phospholipid synthase [Endozoicomonas sp. SCSIO W0465]